MAITYALDAEGARVKSARILCRSRARNLHAFYAECSRERFTHKNRSGKFLYTSKNPLDQVSIWGIISFPEKGSDDFTKISKKNRLEVLKTANANFLKKFLTWQEGKGIIVICAVSNKNGQEVP